MKTNIFKILLLSTLVSAPVYASGMDNVDANQDGMICMDEAMLESYTAEIDLAEALNDVEPREFAEKIIAEDNTQVVASATSEVATTNTQMTAHIDTYLEASDEGVTTESTSIVTAYADDDSFGESAGLGDDTLEESRGTGLGNVFLNSDVTANMTNNTTNGGVTGNNQISDGAFNNASGIIVGIQNSGNNVIIQNSMNLSVSFEQ